MKVFSKILVLTSVLFLLAPTAPAAALDELPDVKLSTITGQGSPPDLTERIIRREFDWYEQYSLQRKDVIEGYLERNRSPDQSP